MSTQQNTSSAGFGLRAVQFSRLTRRGILLGLSLPQLIVLAVGVLSIVGALYAGGGMLLAWTAPDLAALCSSRLDTHRRQEAHRVGARHLPVGGPHAGTADGVPAAGREAPSCGHARSSW